MKDQVYSNTWVPTRVNTNQHGSTRVWHESTQINTSPTRVQHKSTQVRHESTRINTSLTQVYTNQHESDTTQHDSNTSQHEATPVQNRPWKRDKHMVRRKDKTWLNGGVEDCIYQDLGFLLKFMTNWTIKNYFFCKGIYFIKRCVIIYLIFFPRKI